MVWPLKVEVGVTNGPGMVLAAAEWAGEGGRKYVLEDIDPLGDKCKQVANVRNADTFPLYLYEQPLATDMCYSKNAHMENKRDSSIPHFFF